MQAVSINGKRATIVSTGAFSVTCRGPRGGRIVLLKCRVNGVWMVSQNGKSDRLYSHSGFELPSETDEERVKRLFPLACIRAVPNGFQKPGYVVELPGRTLWGSKVKHPTMSGAKTVPDAWSRAAEELRLK